MFKSSLPVIIYSFLIPGMLKTTISTTTTTTTTATTTNKTTLLIKKQFYNQKELNNITIGYCTDIEGNYIYWKRYLKLSKVIKQTKNGLELNNNCYFIFGGDVCDRGNGDIRILQDLIQLKESNPDKVHLILGNRDLNKMRLLTELQYEAYSQPGETFWTGQIKQTDEFNASNRLKAILTQTMGAPNAFEYRRQELKEMSRNGEETITDEQVTQSFLDSVGPNGLMTKYIAYGTLAVLLGDCFFFHGGLHENTIGFIPPSLEDVLQSSLTPSSNPNLAALSPSAIQVTPSSVPNSPALPILTKSLQTLTLLQWIEELEKFKSNEIQDYIKYSSLLFSSNPPPSLSSIQHVTSSEDGKERFYGSEIWSRIGGYSHPAAGGRLLQYGMGWLPDKSVNPTLIYDNYLLDGAPSPPSSNVTQYLQQAGIKKVITGHQPHGDAPVVMSKDGIQFITGDTSYAKDVKWTSPFRNEQNIGQPSYQEEQLILATEILNYIHRRRYDSQEQSVFNYHDVYETANRDRLNSYEELRKSEKDGIENKESKETPNSSFPSENIQSLENILFKSWDSPSNDSQDTRGVAVSEIYFQFDDTESPSIGYIHGILSNGLPYHFSLSSSSSSLSSSTSQSQSLQSNLVGSTTTDGWWIKAILSTPLPSNQASSVQNSSTPIKQEISPAHISLSPVPNSSSSNSISWGGFLSSIICGCQQNSRPITPTAPNHNIHLVNTSLPSSSNQLPSSNQLESSLDNETIYLVCYSRGRDVFNSFIKGKDLKNRLIRK